MVDDVRPHKKQAENKADKVPAIEEREPVFEPPEIVAEREIKKPEKNSRLGKHVDKVKHHARRTKTWFGGLVRWQQLLVISIVLIVFTATGLWSYAATRPVPGSPPEPQKAEKPVPTTVASPLTGIQVEPELAQLPVTGVMIENSPDARPQAGLRDAGVVFEAIAEGGITRFLALYQESQPKYVGPVRSARPYYIRWLLGFDAGYAHVGGSPEAIKDIRALKVKDLDQFYNPGAYQRVNNRFAPHNVYTGLDKLLKLEKDKGWKTSTFTGFVRKAENPREIPKASTINIGISSPLYNVQYSYQKLSNSYLRNMGGAKHKDEKSGKQIAPKVVVVLVTTQGIASDGLHTTYKTTGSGRAFIFQDGSVTFGTWEKKKETDQIRFGNAEGAPLGLNPGQTWVTVVGNKSAVSYKP